ncbi:hypothetical protein M409DRAFT_16001 [Zasmidium cellare ATCC 36951]|uniref:Uncharacterized protein n=1 Tax=Zasmidium cellare ATCC 36951 TaxID=1080233 RepID=A0A6A6D2T0_ZASCE|nr:uncharacterized protein M409DRAFT_16001 [Zasmidium cellare ATCC 36951]KAF2173727.1 hypothetical protein M409DRAFT_16001 [Zasmidium cellare ATCC 36951]
MFGRFPNGLDSYAQQQRSDGGGDFSDRWRSMSPNGRRDFPANSSNSTTSAQQQRSGAYHRITFEQAVADMVSALDHANKGLLSLETTFGRDVDPLKLWLPSQHVDSLWIIYTAWNGIPATGPAKRAADLKTDGSKKSAIPPPTTYIEITHRISKALTGLRQCSPPSGGLADHYQRPSHLNSDFRNLDSPNSGLGWHVLRTTMRKLEISFEAIEELMASVILQRGRMAALRHEIGAAGELLEGIRGLVDCGGGEKGKGTGKGEKGRENDIVDGDDFEEEEFDWRYCGAI